MFFVDLPGKPIAIVGDSVVSQMLPLQYRLPFPLSDAENNGISGATSLTILNILPQIIERRRKIIIIEGGVNDFRNNLIAETAANYDKIIRLIQPETIILVVGILPLETDVLIGEYRQVMSNEKIRAVNAEIALRCEKYANCRYLNHLESLPMRGMTTDGLHLNESGYQLIGSAIREVFIEKILQ